MQDEEWFDLSTLEYKPDQDCAIRLGFTVNGRLPFNFHGRDVTLIGPLEPPIWAPF